MPARRGPSLDPGKLRRLREQQGLTQEDLARLIGRKRTTIAQWEMGERGISHKNFAALVAALNVATRQLLGTARSTSEHQRPRSRQSDRPGSSSVLSANPAARRTGLDPGKLRRLREQQGLTQEDLARLIGRKRTTIAQWETSNRGITPTNLAALAQALKVAVEDLTRSPAAPEGIGGLRRQRGLSQQQVAARLGVSPATYGRFERGERALPGNLDAALAALLGVSPRLLTARFKASAELWH